MALWFPVLWGAVLQVQALATHVVPLVPSNFLEGYCACGSPDQCVVTFVVTIVRALMFHSC